MYEQRPPRPPERTELFFESPDRYWEPVELHAADISPDQYPRPLYVVVEDTTPGPDGEVVLDVGFWPRLDEDGRLNFEESAQEHAMDESLSAPRQLVETVLARWRDALGQAQRPIRVGDAFFIQTDLMHVESPNEWQIVIDVTASARDAAKVAFHAATMAPVEAERSGELNLQPQAETDQFRGFRIDPDEFEAPGPAVAPSGV